MGISLYNLNLFLTLCLSLCYTHLALGSDTITANNSISGDQTITSSGGSFELGFYKPGNSSNYYISMWYKKVSTKTIAWVANRDTPVTDIYSTSLQIIDANLVLSNKSQTIWSTNQTLTRSSSVVAVLRDDGNLVLLERGGSSQPIWQSFDHITHTWFPGGKISYNKKTKTHQKLTSWKSSEDPSPGLFSLTVDADKKQYIITWNDTERYWTSGPWNGKIFSLVPEMRSNYIYNFSYVDNENESYFTYSMYDDSIISRFIMDISGQVKQLTWLDPSKEWNLFWSQPRQQCEVYAYCGAFGTCNSISQPFCNCLNGYSSKSDYEWKLSDYSDGCMRNTHLQCGNSSLVNGKKDKFFVYPNMKLPVNPQYLSVDSSSICESSCLKNCSCTAYAFEGNKCSYWIGDLVNLEQLSSDDGSGGTLYLKLAASEFSSSKSNTVLIIGVVVGLVVTVVFLCVFVFIWRKRRSPKTKTVEGSLVAFAYKDLQNATKNFSEKLGGGGFGSVFKGTLPDSTLVAVKKLDSVSQGEKQFRMEVSTIGTIQHVNLVRLRGFCSEGNKKLLVYDYMPNGSLDAHIFREKAAKILDWKTRYQIALGTARGLFYLHEKCRDCIIHCDIKPENILLDKEFCPKVADFGLAKLMGRDFSRVLTTMRGTRGYLAPEWISGVAVTAKADVYSFGMMLFEFLSGRRNADPSEDGKVNFFPSFAAKMMIGGGDILSLLDPRLERCADTDEVLRICRIACWCIQDDETHRPTMGQVVQILEGVLDVNMPPIPRSLQVIVENHENIVFFTESSSSGTSQTKSNTSTNLSQTNNSIPVTTASSQL